MHNGPCLPSSSLSLAPGACHPSEKNWAYPIEPQSHPELSSGLFVPLRTDNCQHMVAAARFAAFSGAPK